MPSRLPVSPAPGLRHPSRLWCGFVMAGLSGLTLSAACGGHGREIDADAGAGGAAGSAGLGGTSVSVGGATATAGLAGTSGATAGATVAAGGASGGGGTTTLVPLPPGVIAAGVQSTCALVGDGTVKCWGRNDFGQLGNGEAGVTTPSTATPVTGLSQVVSVAAGYYHVCALTADGRVSCWGLGVSLGQDPAAADSGTPLGVPNVDQVVMIAAGNNSTCALRRDATVWCWGPGQAATPVGITDATSIAVGEESGCAVLATGSVKCWGWNGYGQLGDGTKLDAITPVSVVGVNDAALLALGRPFSCALRSNFGVTCWGSEIPIGPPMENVVALAAQYENICVVQADRALHCFGQGGRVEVDDVGSAPGLDLRELKGLTVGFAHGCVIAGDQEARGAWCWGPSMLLGDGGDAESHVPVRVHDFP